MSVLARGYGAAWLPKAVSYVRRDILADRLGEFPADPLVRFIECLHSLQIPLIRKRFPRFVSVRVAVLKVLCFCHVSPRTTGEAMSRQLV